MIKALIFDFSGVILFPKDRSVRSVNFLNRQLIGKFGENYNFFDYFELNTELLDYIDSVKSDADSYIFTSDVVQYRPEILIKLKDLFKNIFRAKDLNIEKSNPEAYKIISEKIKVKPEDIFYLDSNIVNINAALDAGFHAKQFRNNAEAIRTINKFF